MDGVLRLTLGIAQMMTALVAALLLWQQGTSTLAILAVLVACVLSTLSVLIFGGRGSR
jgi:hypothetical protein